MSERTLLLDASGNRYLFDAVFSAEHETNVAITSHPVQSGAAVADHAYIEPETVSLEIGMSDAMTSADTLAGASKSRSVSAYQKLRELCLRREIFTLVTRLGSLGTMMISSVVATESPETMSALRAQVTLKKINRVQVCEVGVQQTEASGVIAYQSGGDGGANAQSTGYTGAYNGGTQGATQIDGASHPAGLLKWLIAGAAS